jgi:hypothetical protein
MSLNDKASAALRRELAKCFPERPENDPGHGRLADALTKPDVPAGDCVQRDTCAYWWTYQGYKGHKAHALAHATQNGADWHHGMATSLGGAFDCAGRTTRPITEAEMRAGLASRFPAGVEVVNPARTTGGEG